MSASVQQQVSRPICFSQLLFCEVLGTTFSSKPMSIAVARKALENFAAAVPACAAVQP